MRLKKKKKEVEASSLLIFNITLLDVIHEKNLEVFFAFLFCFWFLVKIQI
jgi:hypothetical protein